MIVNAEIMADLSRKAPAGSVLYGLFFDIPQPENSARQNRTLLREVLTTDRVTHDYPMAEKVNRNGAANHRGPSPTIYKLMSSPTTSGGRPSVKATWFFITIAATNSQGKQHY